MVITYMKNGKINAFHQDFQGDIKKLETLAKGGSVSSLKLDASWGAMKGIPQNRLPTVIKNYQRMGYKIIEFHEK